MSRDSEKIKRLVQISRMYYEEDKKQSEIAQFFGISRPLVSRMLKEAKEMGVVRIEICLPEEGSQTLLNQVRNIFPVRGGILIPNGNNDVITNERIVLAALEYMQNMKQANYGLGWGHIIGAMIGEMEKHEPYEKLAQKICPLMGNSEVSNRNYHSNELVRIFAAKTNAKPEYLYAPAFVMTEQEMLQFQMLENYRTIEQAWSELDVAIVNIGNYPSTPDFASEARYGDALRKKHAVGKILNYFCNAQGMIFHSDNDYAIRISLEMLRNTKHVIGICSANIKEKAILGALRTGLIHYLIAPEQQTKQAVQMVLMK